MSDLDDMPVLMSAPNADAPTLARVELGEETITLELHYPAAGEVGVLTLGFRGKPRLYILVETGYTRDSSPMGEMFSFVAEGSSGKRYRWYVHAENPTETFVRINAHLEAKGKEIATAPVPTNSTPSLTDPLRIENEHEPADNT